MGTYSGEVFQATAKAQCYSHVSKRKSVTAVGMLTAKLRKVQEEEEEKEEGLQYGIDNLSDIITNYQMIFTNDSKVREEVSAILLSTVTVMGLDKVDPVCEKCALKWCILFPIGRL